MAGGLKPTIVNTPWIEAGCVVGTSSGIGTVTAARVAVSVGENTLYKESGASSMWKQRE